MHSWAARRLLRRVQLARSAERARAGWAPQDVTSTTDPLVRAVAERWCGGETAAAEWVLARIWWTERARRVARAVIVTAMLTGAVALVSDGPSVALLPVLALAGALATRTSVWWAARVEANWPRDTRTHMRLLRRRGRRLPARVLESPTAWNVLMPAATSPAVDDIVRQLRGEWQGTVADLLEAADRLAA